MIFLLKHITVSVKIFYNCQWHEKTNRTEKNWTEIDRLNFQWKWNNIHLFLIIILDFASINIYSFTYLSYKDWLVAWKHAIVWQSAASMNQFGSWIVFFLFYRLIIYCRWYSTADWLLMLLWLIFTTVHKLSEFLCQCSCEIPQNMFKTFSRFLIKYLSESRSIFEYWRNHIYGKNQTFNLKTSKKFGRNLLEVYRFIWFQLLLL